MKSNYEERKANRLEAFQNLAAKNAHLSVMKYEQANHIASFIPMGQPILVGHHSEKRHRRDLAKIDSAMGASIEADKKADYYADRAETILTSTVISSDDPNAIDKLQAKLAETIADHERMKAGNKVIAKAKKDGTDITEYLTTNFDVKPHMVEWTMKFGLGSCNTNANIKRLKDRIAHLTRISAIQSSEEEINGITLKVSAEDNRVQIFFPSIPSEEIRKQLKSFGFHWSPSVGAWMKMLSGYAIRQAKDILSK